MSDNWVVQNLQNALDTWNSKLAEIWQILTQSPENFKGGGIWQVIVQIHGALQAIGYALLVLFFVVGVVKTCGSFTEVKRPEHALKIFIRFAIAKGVVTYLKDGMLRVQLTQKDFTTKQIEITVTDGAGNTSEKYVLQNPYYEWAKKQAEKQKTSSNSNGAMATTTSADATGTEKTTTSPLPQDAQASEPTDAKGTVDDRTVTGIEEQLNKEGETADSVTKTATEGTKEFYTISTKSGKIFYLIIDNSKSQDNVYFLTEVSEKDLMNFTLSDSVTLPEVDTVYAEPEKQAEEEKPETTETAEKDKVEDEIQMPEDKSPFGTYLLIALVAVGAAAGGYYFKVYKPKHEYDDEDEMEEDEDESEDSESEKREVDDADEQEESIEPEILRDEDFDDAVLEDEEEEQE